MTTDILRLGCDNLVIGSGLAGLTAALRLRGKTVVASAGLGATAISGGAMAFPQERDLDAERWLLDILRNTGCPYREGRCMTELGVVRQGLVQEAMDFEGTPAVIALDGKPVNGGVALNVEPFAGRSCQEIAHMIETDDAVLDVLGYALAAIGSGSYLLPPVLGVSRASRARHRLEQVTGARIYEYVTAPSVLGLRLLWALREVTGRNKDVTVLEMTRIESLGDGARGHLGTKGKREVIVDAAHLILATGGPLTGFRAEGDRVKEPLTGITVGGLEADTSYTFATDHPLMFKGIGTQQHARGGFGHVRAAGAVAAGFGLYEALRTGFHAGDGL
jgi:glycerol-3-phosphate dehydrogenase subunit B